MNPELLNNLSKLQDGLNEYITPNWKENRTQLDFMICNHQEMAELIDTECTIDSEKYGLNWKWWKSGNNGKRTMDKIDWNELHPAIVDNIKIELTDLVFFTLSQKILEDLTNPDDPIQISDNDWLNFMSITANNLMQRPGMALNLIITLSDKIHFNISAYYCSKHLLNYWRQISKYGVGYEKKDLGIEDNEMLHQIINDITLDEISNNFDETYNIIATRFFEIFKTPKEKEITVEYWYKILDERDA